jgi:hypothetical protein
MARFHYTPATDQDFRLTPGSYDQVGTVQEVIYNNGCGHLTFIGTIVKADRHWLARSPEGAMWTSYGLTRKAAVQALMADFFPHHVGDCRPYFMVGA